MKMTPLELFDQMNTLLATNEDNQITAADVRQLLGNFIDTFSQVLVNVVTTSPYVILDANRGNLTVVNNAGATAVSIAQAGIGSMFVAGWSTQLRNQGAGTVTITPAISQINGAATLVLTTGKSCEIVSDGVNYWATVASPT